MGVWVSRSVEPTQKMLLDRHHANTLLRADFAPLGHNAVRWRSKLCTMCASVARMRGVARVVRCTPIQSLRDAAQGAGAAGAGVGVKKRWNSAPITRGCTTHSDA